MSLRDEKNVWFDISDSEPVVKKKKKTVSGWYFPPEVVVLFKQGEINPRDLVVLGTVNSLTRTYENGQTIGCFASNKTLGDMCHISSVRVSKIISKLIKLEVVTSYTKQNQKRGNIEQRYILPAWRKSKKRPVKND